MSSADIEAINTYMVNTVAKTPAAQKDQTDWKSFYANLGFFDKMSDSTLANASAKRDRFNTDNGTPPIPSVPLTAEEKKYFDNIPIVDVTGMTPEQANKAAWTPKPGAAKAPISLTVSRAQIKQGSKGDNVKEWQRIIGVNPDGVFGAGTKAATMKWQTAHGLKADGIVGPNTWAVAYGDAPKFHPEVASASTPASKGAAEAAGTYGPASTSEPTPIQNLPKPIQNVAQKTVVAHATGLKEPVPVTPPNTKPVVSQAGMFTWFTNLSPIQKLSTGIGVVILTLVGIKVSKSKKYGVKRGENESYSSYIRRTFPDEIASRRLDNLEARVPFRRR